MIDTAPGGGANRSITTQPGALLFREIGFCWPDMSNALAREKSPYLLQHADNPVDWRPWGEAAFALARAEDKPIFLSIGYSTCHWCHVMAHESFEDAEIAALLNAHFVPVKVDREERPDVDRVYMTYVQATTGHGGWPMSVWLTPALKPFYGGTYFPPEDRQGRPGFPAVLRALAEGWKNEREKLVAEGDRVVEMLRRHAEGGPPDAVSVEAGAETSLAVAAGAAFEQGFQYFHDAFDPKWGGFGGAPKFPRASTLNFLFRVAALQGTESAEGAEIVRLAETTLQKMAEGGLHDQVGGGFHRYSVDEEWFVPHFEKMLYDQAQIALNCLEARQATKREVFAWVARGIFDYVARDLTGPDGGFYSAEDADSAVVESAGAGGRAAGGKPAHAEGAFYLWTAEELRALLGDGYGMFAAHYGVAEDGNVAAARDPQGEFRGKNILRQRQSIMVTAKAFQLAPEEAGNRLLAALETVRAARARRPRPHLDDKIITAWNGLMISALAKGHQVLESRLGGADTPCLTAATRAVEFVQRELYDAAGDVLYRSYRKGRGAAEGFADDHAFLIQGLLDLYEAGFDLRWLRWAERLQSVMDARFWDGAHGGYFDGQGGDASILLRLKEDYDGAEPSANSVAALNLLRLAWMLGESAPGSAEGGPGRTERARRTIEAFRAQWKRSPQAMPQMLLAVELALQAPRHVVIAGDPTAADFRALAAVAHEKLGPRRALLAADGGAGQAWLAARLPAITGMRPLGGRATAYVCEHFACQRPVLDATELRELLA